MLPAMPDHSLQSSLNAARKQFFDGEIGPAIQSLERLERKARNDHRLLQHIAEMYLQCSQHGQAARCYARSLDLQPANPDYVYNLAAAKTSLGEFEEAEALLNHAIKLNPEDYGAWLNRSGLRKQTPSSNHVEQLDYVRSRLAEDDPGHVQICYALAKELEDLGRHGEAFRFLQFGSHRRRLGMTYDVREDEEAMALIARQFNVEVLSEALSGHASQRPVFILGLPRSGTTLVDRIISSHSRVGSLGEHNTLPLALMNMAGRDNEPLPGKQELIERATEIDFSELGRRYCEAVGGFGDSSENLIDKTPLNFLYLGLIHLALPNAKIIHLRPHPMDICYAIYKTLFRAGYPFSYSLQEVGRYYIAYSRLMDHWRATIPGAFLDVDYESLVADQEGQTRRILGYLELEWEGACLEFHRHRGPAATASAAQVRQPIYSSSVGLWRRYEKQLAPFAAKLREHGIEVEAA